MLWLLAVLRLVAAPRDLCVWGSKPRPLLREPHTGDERSPLATHATYAGGWWSVYHASTELCHLPPHTETELRHLPQHTETELRHLPPHMGSAHRPQIAPSEPIPNPNSNSSP